MVDVDPANPSDREEIEKLIGEYHTSEEITPIKDRIAWTVDQQLRGESPDLLLVARDMDEIRRCGPGSLHAFCGAWTRHDRERFLRRSDHRRKGVGRELAKRLVEECRLMRVDEIGLEVLTGNEIAAPSGSRWASNPRIAFYSERGVSSSSSFSRVLQED